VGEVSFSELNKDISKQLSELGRSSRARGGLNPKHKVIHETPKV
jgi:hypothetical protein